MDSLISSLVLHGPRDLRHTRRPLPPPPPHHVQIAVLSTGLCGSDLHYYLHARNGAFALQAPLVLGHESAGVITAVGPLVTHLRPGQHVAIEAGIPCGSCEWCRSNRYNLCEGMRFRSSAKTFPHLDGTMQTRINHPAKHVHVLPCGVSCEQGALAEPLSVVLQASRRAGVSRNTRKVLVFGAGAIGMLAAGLARSRGVPVEAIAMVDINQQRLAFAKSRGLVGKIYCLTPQAPAKGVDGLERSRAQAEVFGGGYDVVYECTGAEPCIQMAVYNAKSGGKVLLIGMGTSNALIPISNAATREVDIIGSFRYADTYKEALELLASNSIPPIMDLVTHRVPFNVDAVKKAFEAMAKGKDEKGQLVIKIIIDSESLT
ncbi:chaperonin 10-like protein [Armillaria mellea]|nr:chaperonin 10-like protein [Armillaria mellea]